MFATLTIFTIVVNSLMMIVTIFISPDIVLTSILQLGVCLYRPSTIYWVVVGVLHMLSFACDLFTKEVHSVRGVFSLVLVTVLLMWGFVLVHMLLQ